MCLAGDGGEVIRPRVAVLECHDRSEYVGHMLGRRVAAALHRALQTTDRWQCLELSAVRRACEEMQVEPPFAVGYQQALAHRLGADVVVAGRIEGVAVNALEGTVTVRLILDFVDRIGGQSMMALEAVGSSRRSAGGPRPTDIIVSEALADACRAVAELADTVPAYTGQVVAVSAKELSIQSASDVPVTTGDRLLLYRVVGGEQPSAKLIGVLMVKNVEGAQVKATVLARDGDIYTGDVAVCVGPAHPGVKATH